MIRERKAWLSPLWMLALTMWLGSVLLFSVFFTRTVIKFRDVRELGRFCVGRRLYRLSMIASEGQAWALRLTELGCGSQCPSWTLCVGGVR